MDPAINRRPAGVTRMSDLYGLRLSHNLLIRKLRQLYPLQMVLSRPPRIPDHLKQSRSQKRKALNHPIFLAPNCSLLKVLFLLQQPFRPICRRTKRCLRRGPYLCIHPSGSNLSQSQSTSYLSRTQNKLAISPLAGSHSLASSIHSPPSSPPTSFRVPPRNTLTRLNSSSETTLGVHSQSASVPSLSLTICIIPRQLWIC